MDYYSTIASNAEALYKEKGSKFYAFAFAVAEESDIKNHLEALKKKYFDASHHCYAYVLGTESPYQRANDDGEPNHSAGDPILGQIKSLDLANVLVVVVRYFGGTKLGVSGLIHAYKTAASEALQNAGKKIVKITDRFQLRYPYDHTSEVMRIVDGFTIDIIDQQFAEDCLMVGRLLKSQKESFKNAFNLLESVDLSFK